LDIQGNNITNSSTSTNSSVSPFSSLSSTSPPPRNFKIINNPMCTKTKDMINNDEPCVSYDSKKNVTSFQPSVQKSQYFRSFRSASRRFFGINNNNANNNNNQSKRQTNYAKSNNKELEEILYL